jgi:hypothetical protein
MSNSRSLPAATCWGSCWRSQRILYRSTVASVPGRWKRYLLKHNDVSVDVFLIHKEERRDKHFRLQWVWIFGSLRRFLCLIFNYKIPDFFLNISGNTVHVWNMGVDKLYINWVTGYFATSFQLHKLYLLRMRLRYDHELLFGKELDGGVHVLGEGIIPAIFWKERAVP